MSYKIMVLNHKSETNAVFVIFRKDCCKPWLNVPQLLYAKPKKLYVLLLTFVLTDLRFGDERRKQKHGVFSFVASHIGVSKSI